MKRTAESLQRMADLFRCFGSPARLQILLLLADLGEMSVTDLLAITGWTQANASHHLHSLKLFGLVSCRRSDKYHYYRIDPERLADRLHSAAGVSFEIGPLSFRHPQKPHVAKVLA